MDLRLHLLRHLRDDGARSSRTWSGASGSPTPVSAEETHIQVRLATWQALEAEDLLTSALERADALKRQLVLDGDDDLTPLLLAITDPAVLRAELDLVRAEYNSQRLHSGIGYVTPLDEHEGRRPATRKDHQDELEQAARQRRAHNRRQRHNQTNPEDHNDA